MNITHVVVLTGIGGMKVQDNSEPIRKEIAALLASKNRSEEDTDKETTS